MMNRDDVRYRLLENKVESLKEEICSYEQSIRRVFIFERRTRRFKG